MKICKLCENSTKGPGAYCDEGHTKVCESCSKTFVVKNPYGFEKVRACSPSCRSKLSHSTESKLKRKANSLAKHGTEYPQQTSETKDKARKSNLEKYDAEWPNQNKAVREKGYETNKERYGVAHPLQNQELKKKFDDSLEARYGVRYPLKSSELKARVTKTVLDRFGVKSTFQSEAVKEKIRQTILERYGTNFPSQAPEIQSKIQKTYEENSRAGKHLVGRRISKINLSWQELIQTRFPGVTITLEHAVGGKSFDLFIEEIDLAIEINPTVTHNSFMPYVCLLNSCDADCLKHKQVPLDQHQKKAQLAMAHNLSLIQIYDWDTVEQILSLLSGKLEKGFTKYSARKLKIVTVTTVIANEFLGVNHFQGGVRGQAFCYGLKTETDELIAVATFGKARFGAKAETEWLRYAVKSGVIIHGGANALFKHFMKEVKPASVISYVDFDHTTKPQLFLQSCGFKELKQTGASLVWSKKDKRIYNNSLLRQGADRLLNTSYGSQKSSGMSNKAIMLKEGWLPVYTSGNRVFLWEENFKYAPKLL